MEFSKLSNFDKIIKLNEIDSIKPKFRKKLNFDDSLTFGTEIEYGNAYRKKLIKVIDKFMVDKSNNYYGKWQFTDDYSFTYTIDDKIFGGEVKTSVFINKEEYFKELYIMCKKLKKYKAIINDKMAIHVHVSAKSLGENPNILINFLKLYTAYEHIIYKFGYNGSNPRKVIDIYANPIRKILIDFILKYDNSEKEFYSLINGLTELVLAKRYGVNFGNVSCLKDFINTIEFRMCNGTIDPVVIQNEINLFCNLILSLNSNKIDLEYLDYRIKNLSSGPFDFREYKKIYIDDAFEFADMIYSYDIDKEYFIKQYIKR